MPPKKNMGTREKKYMAVTKQMPAKKSARRTRSKTFKRCSRQGKPGCARKQKTCSYNKRRTPRCQPIRKSRAKSRKTSRKSSPKHGIGGLMTDDELKSSKRQYICNDMTSTKKKADGACRPPWDCTSPCAYDKKSEKCVPQKDEFESSGKFMDGTKYLTFRSNKKPAFTFRIPINEETLYGKYAGAIRLSPITGKLHLCYGPLMREGQGSDRPVLSMLVKDKVNKDLWMWFVNSGLALQEKRTKEHTNDAGVEAYYAEIYNLPGAHYQLSYTEFLYLQSKTTDGESVDKYLAKVPDRCPSFCEDDDCFKMGSSTYEKVAANISYNTDRASRGQVSADFMCKAEKKKESPKTSKAKKVGEYPTMTFAAVSAKPTNRGFTRPARDDMGSEAPEVPDAEAGATAVAAVERMERRLSARRRVVSSPSSSDSD